jgi:predicted HicB family RNase H-like nuclease
MTAFEESAMTTERRSVLTLRVAPEIAHGIAIIAAASQLSVNAYIESLLCGVLHDPKSRPLLKAAEEFNRGD